MNARIERRYTTFADYPRYEYVLRVAGKDWKLDGLFLGLTIDQARNSLQIINDNREKLSLEPITILSVEG